MLFNSAIQFKKEIIIFFSKDKGIFLKTYDTKQEYLSGEIYTINLEENITLIFLRKKPTLSFDIFVIKNGIVIDVFKCKFTSKNIKIDEPMRIDISLNDKYNTTKINKICTNDFLAYISNKYTPLKKIIYETKKYNSVTYLNLIFELQKIRENVAEIGNLYKILSNELLCYLNSLNIGFDITFEIPIKLIYENK